MDTSSCLSADAAAPEATLTNEANHAYSKRDSRNSRAFFLPQKPYMVLGTLRQQLLYPTWSVDPEPTSGSDSSTGMRSFIMQFIHVIVILKCLRRDGL